MIKHQVKKIIGWIIYLFENKSKKNFLDIFVFHEITNNPSKFQKKHKIFHKLNDFKIIIKWIAENYNIISPLEIGTIKKNSALITFDDGYEGVFKNAIPYLLKNNIPSLHFLNMKPIIDNEPSIVSRIEFLKDKNRNFKKFLIENKIEDPIYEINPDIFKKFNESDLQDKNEIIEYQGKLVSTKVLRKYSNSDLIFYGNHLYDHWNIINLNMKNIRNFYFKNKNLLKRYKNFIDIFAFTHGIPLKNFSKKNLNQILSFKPMHIFYSSGGNKKYNSKTYDRTFLTKEDIKNKIFYFRKFRAKFLF